MTTDQIRFWESVKDFAANVRRSKRVDLLVAADALWLEQEVESKLVGAAPRLAAARRDPAVTARDPFADESKAQG